MPIINCETGEIREETPEEIAASRPSPEALWSFIRQQRDTLLAASDWTQVADAPTDKAAWAAYRQALRDITMQDDPFTIVWPVAPETK